MSTLRGTVDAWNNLGHEELAQQWKFLISDDDEPVGYIPDAFVDLLHWNERHWQKDSARKIMRLVPQVDKSNRRMFVDACNLAMLDFCEHNQDVEHFSKALKPWIIGWKRGRWSVSGFHAILTPRDDLRGTGIPGVARGIFGIMTAGVHLNAYTSEGDDDKVHRIWVARRSQLATYPGLLDQIVAGGMDLADGVDPSETLRHEAEEEAMWRHMGGDGRKLLQSNLSDARSKELIGEVQDAGRIYFCLRKDASAGVKEENHIEPGVRFCFDLRIKDGIEPVPNYRDKAIGSFLSLSVSEVVASLEARQWKPNSGLVMLDFLLRKGLVCGEKFDEKSSMIRDLRRKPPLRLPEFSHSEPDLEKTKL